MLHLTVLLANPGTEIPAAELAAGADALASRADVSTQPVLDRTTVQQYRARLASLRETIEAKGAAVGKAIRRAIDRIEAVDPPIGRHLRDAVRTGRSCSYRPTSAP
jgi:hypothetical protein